MVYFRVFFALFLKHQKEAMKDKKKPKKSRQNLDQGNRLSIIVDNYDADVFRNFLLFVHCGTVLMDPTTVTGKSLYKRLSIPLSCILIFIS